MAASVSGPWGKWCSRQRSGIRSENWLRHSSVPPGRSTRTISRAALAGASFGPWLGRRLGTGRLLLASAVLSVPSVLLMPLGDGVVGMVAFSLGNALFAFFTMVLSVITRTYRQQESPPELLVRVMATVRFVSWSVIPVGAFLAGLIAEGTSARTRCG